MKQMLTVEYKMTDQGDILYILGINITRNCKERTLYLNQSRYINTILRKFNMQDCNPANTPADTTVKLKKGETNDNRDTSIPYCKAVGSLMYLMLCTRPNIAVPTIKLAQYTTCFNNIHWTAVKQVMRYVKGTINNVLVLGNVNNTNKRKSISKEHAIQTGRKI